MYDNEYEWDILLFLRILKYLHTSDADKRMVPAARCYNNTPGKFLRHPSFFCGSSNPAK